MQDRSLLARQQKLRISVRELAVRAGLDQMNVSRVLKGTIDARLSTVRKIERALRDEEQQMKEYLDALIAERPAEEYPEAAA